MMEVLSRRSPVSRPTALCCIPLTNNALRSFTPDRPLSALQLLGGVEGIPDSARFFFSFFPTARLRAGQCVLAIAINVQPLYTVAPSPIRPVSLGQVRLCRV